VATTFLDWLTGPALAQGHRDNLDIKKARKVLDDDHYGLDKPKRRIIEYLAVRQLKPDSKGPILCFAGPSGHRQNLARPVHCTRPRPQVLRMSLAGCGTRPKSAATAALTVGALPGRVIQGIRRAESNNPVFMLDEIDKLGADFRGDPSVGPAGGARPGAEPLLPGPLPGCAVRPVQDHVHRHGQYP